MNVIEEVASIVARVRALGLSPRDETAKLDEEIAKLFGESDLRVHRYHEYVVQVALGGMPDREADNLKLLRELEVTAAPELAAIFETSEGYVIIRRYWACPGERLVHVERSRVRFSQRASAQFRSEMQRLIAHGHHHAGARGFYHWWVSEKSGTIVLDSWSALQPCTGADCDEQLDLIDRNLADRATSRIIQRFRRAPVLLPVVHPIGRDAALSSLKVIADARVPGAFLINQGMNEREVLALVREARTMFPTLWLGVNLLGRRPADALAVALDACGRIDGIWSDNAGIDERADTQAAAEEFLEARTRLGWTGLYFGGVAFKYQREVPSSELGRTAALAARYMDVVCTSGPGTGHAADPEKVRAMHEGLGDTALAIASGITADNVGLYLPYTQAFLVGTGIEARLGVIDPEKLSALLDAIRRLVPES